MWCSVKQGFFRLSVQSSTQPALSLLGSTQLASSQRTHRSLRRSLALALGISLGLPSLTPPPAQAQLGMSCSIAANEVNEKSDLLRAAVGGDRKSQRRYEEQLKKHRDFLQDCRRKNWPKNQAVWLRLYPCDVKPGVLEQVLDQAVNMGYNQVYVEVFYDGRVLLPQSENRTAWPSVLNTPDQANTDLFAQSLTKGRERGLQIYAWMYTMNFGHSYGQRNDRRLTLARNGRGQSSREIIPNTTQTFIDPYNPLAIKDYYDLVQAVVKRRPDGVLFDYIRYPRGSGADSAVGIVKDLLVYSPASRQALIDRATNRKGRELISRFLSQGFLSDSDIKAINQQYPLEGEPQWQGRIPSTNKNDSLKIQQVQLQQELWLLSVAHAYQGVVDFLNMAARPVRQAGIAAGAVFFPGGNQTVGRQGFDSRMQPWDRFADWIERHPMAYSTCGDSRCIVEEIQTVVQKSGFSIPVQPALAGAWGRSEGNRPSLEQQMADLRQFSNRIDTVSHFAYSWQQPQNDTNRKFCRI